MRWLGLALALVAGLLLAWDVFELPGNSPGQKGAPAALSHERHFGRVLSGIGITTGFLLIVIGARKLGPGETEVHRRSGSPLRIL
jgi:hypothetical protein